MLLAALVLLGSLALGAQVVSSVQFDKLTFTSIEQCGSFNVSFEGDATIPATTTLTLNILPFNSSLISISVPPSSWDSVSGAGAVITFLPLPAGSTFIAQLLEADTGEPVSFVSDVIKIEDSDDTSCLPSSTTEQLFTVEGSPSQCETFNVSFSDSTTAPTVQAFVPNFFFETLNQSTSSNVQGEASYILPVFRGFEVAFLFEDSDGNKQVSDLYPVGGDASSSTSCFPFNVTALAEAAKPSSTSSLGGLSRGATVAIGVVSGTAVGTVVVLLAWFFWRERRRRLERTQNQLTFNLERGPSEKWRKFNDDPPAMTQPSFPSMPASRPPQYPLRAVPGRSQSPQTQSRYLANPPYRTEDFASPTSQHSRINRSKTVRTMDSGIFADSPVLSSFRRKKGHDGHNQSIETLDIEGMLEAATVPVVQTPRTAGEGSGNMDTGVIDGTTMFATSRDNVPVPKLSPPPAALARASARLGARRSDENLDVPLTATDYGRFSDVVMDYPREALADEHRDSSNVGERFMLSTTKSFVPVVDNGFGGVRDSGAGYATFKANLASRPVARPS